jgi:alkylated DNA repair dioxygenase AlkB
MSGASFPQRDIGTVAVEEVALGRDWFRFTCRMWGGKRRSDPVRRLHLESGDIVVWGGLARSV